MTALFRNHSVRLSTITDAFSHLRLQHKGPSFVQQNQLQLRSISQTRPGLLNKLAGANLTTASDPNSKPTTSSASSINTPQLTQLPLPAEPFGAKTRLRAHARSVEGKSIVNWTTEDDLKLFEMVKAGARLYDIYDQHFPHRSFGAVSRRMCDAHKALLLLERQAKDGVQPGEIDVSKLVAGEVGSVPLRTLYNRLRTAQSQKAKEWEGVSGNEVSQKPDVRRRKADVWKGPWSAEEEEMLEQLVERFAHLPEPAIWYRVAGSRVNDSPLLRDALSCARRWRRLHPPERDRVGPWTSEEDLRLQEAIWEQLGGKYQVAVDVFPNKPVVTKHQLSAWRPDLVQLPGQEGLPILKEGSRQLLMLNWVVVAKKVGSRAGLDCRNHFYVNYHNASRGTWTKEERARGKEGLKLFGRDYRKISAHIGTRSCTQVTKMVCYWEPMRKKKEAEAAKIIKDKGIIELKKE
ncbi:hypothetical protein EC991_002905 [Linnemannia zychae]|nr:hypothetical protein EC991_002905 [Linnemannia zychae]